MPVPLELPVDRPVPLRAVVEAVVRAEVDAFRHRAEEQRFVRVLTERALADGLAQGVVRSGGSETATGVDPEQAVATALLAHADGLYKVIVDGEPVDALDDEGPAAARQPPAVPPPGRPRRRLRC